MTPLLHIINFLGHEVGPQLLPVKQKCISISCPGARINHVESAIAESAKLVASISIGHLGAVQK